jgi:hypothetical protein
MAIWSEKNGWEPFAFPTDYGVFETEFYSTTKPDVIYPYKEAIDFAGDLPYSNAIDFANEFPYKSQVDYTTQYPTTVTFWVKTLSDGSKRISWTQPSGSNWNAKSLTYDKTLAEQFSNQFLQDLNQNEKDSLQAKITELNTNNTTAQTELATYNQQQDVKREQQAVTYNQEQDRLRQEASTYYNQKQDTLREQYVTDNQENTWVNAKNTLLNTWSKEVADYYQATTTGTPENPKYLSNRDNLPLTALDKAVSRGYLTKEEKDFYVDSVKTAYRGYYLKDRIQPWDETTGAQPPIGPFDPLYYRTQTGSFGGNSEMRFNNALRTDDLDILGRFDRDLYSYYHYTTLGKDQGARGNEAQSASLVKKYAEYLTDADYQLYRDRVLGVTDNSILGEKITQLSSAAEKEKETMFGAMTLDTLKESLKALQNAKESEQQFEMYSQLEGFKEVFSISKDITNSIMGDFNAGGIMGIMGNQEQVEDKFKGALEKITGVPSRNTAVYNWQKWFDEQLTQKYKEGTTFQDPTDPTKTYVLDKEFAEKYIKDYLEPRFNASKSMSEFASYLDVEKAEQNIFQTQSAVNALKDIADLRAKTYLNQIYRDTRANANAFDPAFYLNPTGNFTPDDPKIEKYQKQKETIDADYQLAKATPEANAGNTGKTWAYWSYYYGLNINDPQQFARLHYEVLGGPVYNFDGSKDVLTFKDANDYIDQKLMPEIASEKNSLGDMTFMNFVTPESFADNMLQGISPETNKAEWDKLLESQGLAGTDAGVDEVRNYIVNSFRTNAAQQIRESIKYLNQRRLAPTQERLGVEYIERPEDAQPTTTTSGDQTELYQIFKNAGYQGSEDAFYENFMTDIDRSEMELMTQATKKDGLTLGGNYTGLTSKDPFESLGSMESLFAEETSAAKEEETPSYFRLFEEETKDDDYKSESGKKILGEFTSLFKGFS